MKKYCSRCNKHKSRELFYKDKRAKDGLQYYCKKCCKENTSRSYAANRAKRVAYQQKWQRENPEKVEAIRRRRQAKRYGITVQALEAVQNSRTGNCMICRKPWKPGTRKHAADHCHKTGRVRGALCSKCNVGIGLFEDDTVRLQAAIDYLNSNNTFG